MDQLPLWLSALPKEMQGSLMTIAGGAITALFGGIGWLAKTWNDRSKERIKRQMEMRREVFLPAAESIVEAMGFAGGLATDMRPDTEIQTEFIKLARKVAPLQVVGSDATMHASAQFGAKFTAFFMAAMALRQQVRQAHINEHFAPNPAEKAKWSGSGCEVFRSASCRPAQGAPQARPACPRRTHAGDAKRTRFEDEQEEIPRNLGQR